MQLKWIVLKGFTKYNQLSLDGFVVTTLVVSARNR
jgi:hypothetical protein